MLELEQLVIAQLALRVLYGEGQICGGAVRDVLLGREVGDIDFYVEINNYRRQTSSEPAPEWLTDDDPRYMHQYLLGVVDTGKLCFGKPVQILIIKEDVTISEVVDSFDIGLCRISLDTDGQVETTPEFLEDREKEALTVYRSGWGDTGVRQHVEKLKTKYPTFKVIRNDKPTDPFPSC